MSIWTRLKRWRLSHRLNERDAPSDPTTAMTRSTGGDPDSSTPGTTGTGTNDEFVGRVSGDDSETGPSGAEQRAQSETPRG